jgi:hypothetical protein
MEAVHECGVVPHLRRQWAQEMANLLLLVKVNIKISHHYDAAIRPNVLFASTELPRGHVTLHDIDTIFLVEGVAGELIRWQ